MKIGFGISRTAGRIATFWLLLRLFGPLEVPAQSSNADLLLLNAHVVTMNEKQPSAQAIAIRGGRILWVGNTEEDRKSTCLNSSHGYISSAVFCLHKKQH